jgi:hypothetical protein
MNSLKKSSKLIMAVMIIFSILTASLLISENASAHAPAAIYPTYKDGTLTIYIDHASDDPNRHYIKTVTVSVNRIEVINEAYTSQTVDDEKGKGLVIYSYSVNASEGDVISVTAVCSIEGETAETITIGDGGGKDDPKDDPSDDPKGELFPISGVVTDTKSGDAIVGAIVSVYNQDNKDNFYKTQTEPRGYYEVEVATGDYIISVSMDGYISHREIVTINEYFDYNVKLTPGSDSNGKDIDDSKKDDTVKDGDPDQKSESNQEIGETELLLAAIIGVLVVIVILIALLLRKKKGTTKNGTVKKEKTKKDEWTECPKCGSSIRMGQLSSHLDTVHPKLTKKTKEKMLERVTKRD